jgi:hypothetical protein
VHKDILAAPVRSDEAKSLRGVVPLDRADLLDDRLIVRRMDRSLRPSSSGRLLRRGAGVDTQNFGYLRPLGAGTGANLKRRARRHAAVAAALDDTHMQEGIAGSVGKLNEAEALPGVVPFDDGLERGGTDGGSNRWARNSRTDPTLLDGAL